MGSPHQPTPLSWNNSEFSGSWTPEHAALLNHRAEMDDHGHDKRRELEGIQELAARETILIKRWKRLLTVLLLFGAILVATGAFFMLSREEEANYKDAVRQIWKC
jgi:hypothetical protein